MSTFVYKFMKNNYPIYIGKTHNLKERFKQHKSKDADFIKEYNEILVLKLDTEDEARVLESLLITKYKPVYNKAQMHCLRRMNITFVESELNFITYETHKLNYNLKQQLTDEKLKNRDLIVKLSNRTKFLERTKEKLEILQKENKELKKEIERVLKGE